jgi:mannose-6-phosphate isomerase-like protein (cupin superfamily)
MKTRIAQALAQIPAAPTDQYPAGAPSVTTLQHGSMTLKVFRPSANPGGRDLQQPHAQDELYLVHAGSAEIVIDGERMPAGVGDAFFVGAGQPHRFENFSQDFVTWVVFYGPQEGETA